MSYYVYFIQAENKPFSPIKIGVTNNLDKRLGALQTGNHDELNILGVQKFRSQDAMFDQERYLHRRFKKYNVHGEWFKFNLPLAWYMLIYVITWKQKIHWFLKFLFGSYNCQQ